MKIRDLPINQQPREKAICNGVESLNDGELLALIIGSGTKGKSALEIGNELIMNYQNIHLLINENYNNLTKQKGLSTVISLKLSAAFELAKRISEFKEIYQKKISNSYEIYLLYKDIEFLTNEVAYLIYLNKKGIILKQKRINGNYSSSVELSAKEIINDVFISNSDNVILIHNHPNEEINPSPNDIYATEQIRQILKTVGARLLDHIIIAKGTYFSFKDNDLLSIYPKMNAKL